MKIVIDTGIWVSALITKGTPPDQLYQAWRRGEFEVVTSAEQLEELTRVLAYPKLVRFIEQAEAARLLEKLATLEQATDLPTLTDSPDPDDNKIIATAVAGKADIIISGDKRDMLSLGTAQSIPIISARQAVDRLLT